MQKYLAKHPGFVYNLCNDVVDPGECDHRIPITCPSPRGSGGKEGEPMEKRILSILMALALAMSLLPGAALAAEGDLTRAEAAQLLYEKFRPASGSAPTGFGDIDTCTSEQQEAIEALASAGILTGLGEMFDPDGILTRSQAAMLLWRVQGEQEAADDQTIFHDVSATFYAEAVNSLVDQGVLTEEDATDGAFLPNDVATAGTLDTWLSRIEEPASQPSADTTPLTRAAAAEKIYQKFSARYADVSTEPYFGDLETCSESQKTAIYALYHKGDMSGTGQAAFNPTGTVTYGQAAALICRIAGITVESSAIEELAVLGILDGNTAANEIAQKSVVAGWLANITSRVELAELLYPGNEGSSVTQLEIVINSMAGENHAVASFTDIGNCTDQQKAAIKKLYEAAIISGTGPDTFTPNGIVTRAEGAVVLWRAAESRSNTQAVTLPFTIPSNSMWYASAIHCLTAMGVLDSSDGDASGAFNPDGSLAQSVLSGWIAACNGAYDDGSINTATSTGAISRAEMAELVYNKYQTLLPAPEGYTTNFTDIDGCTDSQKAAIALFSNLLYDGSRPIISGTTSATFTPHAATSNAQTAVFLQRVMQFLGVPSGGAGARISLLAGGDETAWYADAVNFLVDKGVLASAEEFDNPDAPTMETTLESWSDKLGSDLLVEAPVFSPAGGTYSSPQTVTITSATEGAAIHYTTDGTEPNDNDTSYTGPITISATTTLKAVAIKEGRSSSVTSATYTISTGGGSSGGGGGGGTTSNTTTETVTNPDGSTTTTTTNKTTGTVTETTKYTDGSTQVVETKKDGTVTTTNTDKDGNKTATVENPDGTTETTVTRKDGSGSTTTVSAGGQVAAEVKLPAAVVEEAAANRQAVTLPMAPVAASATPATAPTVTVELPADTAAQVEIPVSNVTPGTVAVLVKADGTEEVIKTSLTTERGVTVKLSDGDTVKIVDNTKSFSDVPDGYWGADAVAFAASRELFTGTSDTTFAPETTMSRAMIVTVLARFEGVDTSGGETWYEAGRQWAMENGISDGTNMEQGLTREQLALMLYRYAGQPSAGGDLSGFADGDSVSSWASYAMAWAVNEGLISGVGGDTLNSQGEATRVQVAAIFQRFIQHTAF